MHGDLVAVTAQKGERGREGVVVEVLTRRAATVPGTLRLRPRGAWVEPDDARIRGPIMVEDAGDATDGAAVVCEVTRWPEHAAEAPVGRVRETLGAPGALDTEVRKVILREGVEEAFPAEASAEAAGLGADPSPEEIAERVDLRGVPLVTIDPDDARDHDDAVHVAQRPDGGWVATVAIADVSHYVRPGTALDAAAARRGTSIYLPDRAIPMLPRSSRRRSRRSSPTRPPGARGHRGRSPPTARWSRARGGGRDALAGAAHLHRRVARAGVERRGPAARLTDAMRRDLGVRRPAPRRCAARRMKRGALDFDLPEGRVRFEDDGHAGDGRPVAPRPGGEAGLRSSSRR
jgi:ribonuclease R